MSINGPNLVEAAPAANDMEEIDEAINQFVKDKAINILQLGDSYSAGNGAGFFSEYGPRECHRNYRNWGWRLSTRLRAKGVAVNYQNRACSGAKTEAVLYQQEPENGWQSPNYIKKYYNKRFADGKDVISHINRDKTICYEPDVAVNYVNHRYVDGGLAFVWRKGSLLPSLVKSEPYTEVEYRCFRAISPQIDFINQDIDVVMMTLGGNDFNFESIAESCLAVYDREYCPGLLEVAGNKLADQVDSQNNKTEISKTPFSHYYTETLKAILNRLRPDAKVILVGYPQIVEADNTTKAGRQITDRIRSLGSLLNTKQREMVNSLSKQYPGRIQFIDNVADYFEGHSTYRRAGYGRLILSPGYCIDIICFTLMVWDIKLMPI